MWKALSFYWIGFVMGSVSGRTKCEQYYYDYYYNSKRIVDSSNTNTKAS